MSRYRWQPGTIRAEVELHVILSLGIGHKELSGIVHPQLFLEHPRLRLGMNRDRSRLRCAEYQAVILNTETLLHRNNWLTIPLMSKLLNNRLGSADDILYAGILADFYCRCKKSAHNFS